MVVGTVLRKETGGFVVHSDGLDRTLLCQARGRIKKERKSIVTGDRVELDEVDLNRGTAVIVNRLERQNLLSRPRIANVDQVVIVQSPHQPEWNPLLCDRYLVHSQLELPGALPLLCINKCDLAQSDEIRVLQNIYEPLGYKVVIVSAMTGERMDDFSAALAGKISVLAGPSGVGKSSLINYLDPSLHLKVGVVDEDFGSGKHTTTYSALFRIRVGVDDKGQSSWVADTPGFSLSELKHPNPIEVAAQFPEIWALAENCKFSNCLHLVERGCHVLSNLDRVAPSRYRSYSIIVTEAQEEAKLMKETSQKVEAAVKVVGGRHGKGKIVPRLNERYRAVSRRTEKQQMTEDVWEEEEREEEPEERD
jgi:ribosome biogenesis GTPase